MGDDLCSRGRGFESGHHILDGHFFALTFCKNCIVCLKRPKIKKRVQGWLFFKKSTAPTDENVNNFGMSNNKSKSEGLT